MECDAVLGNDDTGAEALIDALNQRRDVAFAVDGAEIDGVSSLQPSRIAPRRHVRGIEERLERRDCEVRVRDVPAPQGVAIVANALERPDEIGSRLELVP